MFTISRCAGKTALDLAEELKVPDYLLEASMGSRLNVTRRQWFPKPEVEPSNWCCLFWAGANVFGEGM